jgi:O-antigen/teichoic acid export membrane protein
VLLVQILLWHLLWLPAIWIPSDLLVAGRVGTLTAMSWATSVVYVALLAILVPTAGAVGAAAATTAYYLLYLAVSVGVFRRVNRRAEPAPDVTVADRLAA